MNLPDYMIRDATFMNAALQQAKLAYNLGEVPVGAIIVKNSQIIAAGHNLRETKHIATAHAEIVVIEEACKILGDWRLEGCELYVTLEPCPMCAGAIVNARISRVVYGARDEIAGCCGSVMDLFEIGFGFKPIAKSGILKSECENLLKSFFENIRK